MQRPTAAALALFVLAPASAGQVLSVEHRGRVTAGGGAAISQLGLLSSTPLEVRFTYDVATPPATCPSPTCTYEWTAPLGVEIWNGCQLIYRSDGLFEIILTNDDDGTDRFFYRSYSSVELDCGELPTLARILLEDFQGLVFTDLTLPERPLDASPFENLAGRIDGVPSTPSQGPWFAAYAIVPPFHRSDVSLIASPTEVGLAAVDALGGTAVDLWLRADACAHGGRPYLLLGTTAGTAPGLPLGAFTLPLNPSAYLLSTLLSPNTLIQGSLGLLDSSGAADAKLALPPGLGPGLAGVTLHHAFVVLDAASGSPLFVSNAAALSIGP